MDKSFLSELREEQKKQKNVYKEETISVQAVQSLLQEIDEDDIPVVDEEAEFDYQKQARERRKKDTQSSLDDDDDMAAFINSSKQVTEDANEPDEPESTLSAVEQAKSIVSHNFVTFLKKDLNDKLISNYVGKPSCIRTVLDFAAVGTTRGLVVLYSIKKAARIGILGTISDSRTTSIDICSETRMLASGYANGEVGVWNLDTCMPLKKAWPFKSAPVQKIVFLTALSGASAGSSTNVQVVAIDSTGGFKLYSVKKNMFSYTVEDVALPYPNLIDVPMMAREKGPINPQDFYLTEEDRVVEVAPLLLGEGFHPIQVCSVLATSTLKSVNIYTFSPYFAKVAAVPNEAKLNVPASIAWKCVELPNGEYKSASDIPKPRNPMLAIGWGNKISLYRLVMDDTSFQLELLPVLSVNVSITIGSLNWLSEQVLAVTDPTKTFVTLVDPYVETRLEDQQQRVTYEVETVEFGDTAYSIDVLQLPGVSNLSMYETVKIEHLSNRLVVLGEKYIQIFHVKSWEQRINLWSNSGFLKEALSYAISLYNGFGKAAVGVPTNSETRHAIVGKKISELLEEYAKSEMNNRVENDEKVYQQVGKQCIEYALQINDTNIFWKLYQHFNAKGYGEMFIALFQPFILRQDASGNALRSLYFGLNQELLLPFVNYYKKQDKYDDLENCLIRLELKREKYDGETDEEYETKMDQVFSTLEDICLSQLDKLRMMRLYTYVHNAFKAEYVSPLKKAFYDQVLKLAPTKAASMSLTKSAQINLEKIAQVLFEYLENCITGQSYCDVFGISELKVAEVKRAIVTHIFDDAGTSTTTTQTSSVKKALELPNFDILVRASPKLLFGLLEKCFADHRSSSPWKNISKEYPAFDRQELAEKLFVYLVNTKIQPFSPENIQEKLLNWPVPVLIEFFSFLTHFVATSEMKPAPTKGDVGIIRSSLFLQKKLIKDELEITYRALQYLAEDKNCDNAVRAKRQNSLKLILQRYDKIPELNRLIRVSEEHGYFKVAIFLHMQTSLNFEKVIECFLKDSVSNHEVFEYINNVDRSAEGHRILGDAIVRFLVDLLKIDAARFTALITHHFTERHQDVMKELLKFDNEKGKQEKRMLLFAYLEQIMNLSETSTSSDDTVSRAPKIPVDEELQSVFVELLCVFKPQAVYDYLKTHETTTKMDEVLKRCEDIAKKYAQSTDPSDRATIEKIEEAICFLYERNGEVRKALTQVMKKLEDKRYKMIELFSKAATELDPSNSAFISFRDFVAEYLKHASTQVPAILAYNLPKVEDNDFEDIPLLRESSAELQRAIDLCARTTSRKTADDPTEPWFILLRSFLEPFKKLRFIALGKDMQTEGEGVGKRKQLLEEIAKQKKKVTESETQFNSAKQSFKETDKGYILKQKMYTNAFEALKKKERELEDFEKSLSSKKNPLNEDDLPQLANLWMQRLFHTFSIKVVRAMIFYVPVPTILNNIVQFFQDDEFGQFKQTIFSLLSLYEFDFELLRNTNTILERDTFKLCKNYKLQLSKGIAPLSDQCVICNIKLAAKKTVIRLFDCGHAYHLPCMTGIKTHQCPVCPEKRGGVRRSKRRVEQNEEENEEGASVVTAKLDMTESVLQDESKMQLHKTLERDVAQARQQKQRESHGLYINSELPLLPAHSHGDKHAVKVALSSHAINVLELLNME